MSDRKIVLYKVAFDLIIDDVAVPRRETTYAIGTTDLNSLVEFIRTAVLQTPVEIQADDQVITRMVTNFDLHAIEDMKFNVSFIDVQGLAAAGILILADKHPVANRNLPDLESDGEPHILNQALFDPDNIG